MRYLLAAIALLISADVMPEQSQKYWWQEGVLGAPCSLKTDIEEGTCSIELRTIDWSRKK